MATQGIPVLPSQVLAAKLLIKIAEKGGRPVSPKVRMIAEASDGRRANSSSPYIVNGTRAQPSESSEGTLSGVER